VFLNNPPLKNVLHLIPEIFNANFEIENRKLSLIYMNYHMVQIFIFLIAGYFLSGPKNCFELPLTKTKFGSLPQNPLLSK